MGWGFSCDAHHVTRSAPTPEAKLKAMRGALHMARLAPDAIVAVNAHGTSTRDNDLREFQALRAFLGDRLADVLVVANKSALGHSLGGGGAIELAVSLLMLRDGQAPPIQNLETPDPQCQPAGFVKTRIPFEVGPILKTSFGFGGLNACGILTPA